MRGAKPGPLVFDASMGLLERLLFPETRQWVCSRARGETLEVGIGTGANLPHYGHRVRLTGVDRNPAMLDLARARANRPVDLQVADAAALPFADESFDSLVCTFALCEVADEMAALTEFVRVLRPGGELLLADHVAATATLVRLGQRVLETLSVPLAGEHFTRRPVEGLAGLGVRVHASRRFSLGAIEQVHARKQ